MDATAIIRLALVVISDRLITILALLTSCGLGCWTMWGPELGEGDNSCNLCHIQLSDSANQGEETWE